MSLTARGWPRPVVDGWPIPWVNEPGTLGIMDTDRQAEVVEYGLCQVCGLGHEPGDTVYVFVAEPPPAEPEGKVVKAMDDAVLHERCMKLARGRCPGLAAQERAGLWMLRAPFGAVSVYQPEETDDFLGIPSEACEVCA